MITDCKLYRLSILARSITRGTASPSDLIIASQIEMDLATREPHIKSIIEFRNRINENGIMNEEMYQEFDEVEKHKRV